MYIFFEDYHHDRGDKVVECTKAEWEQLIAPAVKKKYPIDSATVDSDLFDELFRRKRVDLLLSKVNRIKQVIPLV